MNTEAMLKVADHMKGMPAAGDAASSNEIEGDAVHMSGYLLKAFCGTVGCIAGHTTVLLDPEDKIKGNIPSRARVLLGLAHSEARDLFEDYPRWQSHHINGDDCSAVLRSMLAGRSASSAWNNQEYPISLRMEAEA